MSDPATTLVIDDEPFLPELLADALEDNGLALDIASTWAEGMQKFAVVGHELVVADYDLRESETGLRLLAEIKKLAPSTRLILVSGRLDQSDGPVVDETSAADLFMLRTDPDLRATLIQEAKDAHAKSRASDWRALGQARPRAGDVDLDKIAELEATLRSRLGPAT
jgi:DNA-binding NtrC family response regulator